MNWQKCAWAGHTLAISNGAGPELVDRLTEQVEAAQRKRNDLEEIAFRNRRKFGGRA